MENLKEEIGSKVIVAMKAKDSDTLGVLRNIKGKITELEKSGKDATDEAVQKIVEKYVKQREEGIKMANDAGRQDLVDKETFEINLLKEYLPQKMDEAQTRDAVQEIVDGGANNIGMVMGKLKQFGNTIDMKVASQIAKELLS